MYEYSCKCGYTVAHYLTITNPCPKCNRKLKYIYKPTTTHNIEQKDLPQSQKFVPVYYQDQLWYWRRSPKNTKKAVIKAFSNIFKKKL